MNNEGTFIIKFTEEMNFENFATGMYNETIDNRSGTMIWLSDK